MGTFSREAIATLNSEFEAASTEGASTEAASIEAPLPRDILLWSVETFGAALAVVTSFQPTGIITLHMLSELLAAHASLVAPTILTLDTGLLFPETYALMDEVEARFNLNVKRVQPPLTVAQQAEQYGDALWQSAPDTCCQLRKTAPLGAALKPFSAWITGVRRDQSATRKSTPFISWDEKYQKVKLAPFAHWTERMIWAYLHAHDLPYNALHDNGYPSIGCFPCTQAVGAGEDARSGRWSNHAKTECGIHQV